MRLNLCSPCQTTVPVPSTGWETAAFRGKLIICTNVKGNTKNWGRKNYESLLNAVDPCLRKPASWNHLRLKYCCVLALCQLLVEIEHWVRKTFGLSRCSSYYVHTLKINFWNWTRKKQKLKKSHLPISVFKQARLIDNWHAFTVLKLSRNNTWELHFYPTSF